MREGNRDTFEGRKRPNGVRCLIRPVLGVLHLISPPHW